jgi:DNA-binding XRE family transcriptional regulator
MIEYKLKFMKETKAQIEARANQLVRDHDNLVSSLIQMRLDKGLTQELVGERMGVSQPAVAAFESYEANPTLSTIRRYALAVGASLNTEVADCVTAI